MEWKYVKTISKSKLLEAETKLGIKLSQELRGIILKYNNGRAEKNCFDIKTAKAVVLKKILSYNEEDKDNVYIFRDLIDKGYIPFAITEFGDVICESKEHAIYLYKHELDEFDYVAVNVEEFINKLY